MIRATTAYLVILMLTACGGSGGSDTPTPPPTTETPNPPAPTASPSPTPSPTSAPLFTLVNDPEAQEARRFLSYATFGPTESDIVALSGTDYSQWIDTQMAKPQSMLLPQVDARIRLAGLNPEQKTNDEHAYFKDLHRSDIWWDIAMHGDDQLRQRVAFALSQIMVISNISDTLFHDVRGISDYHDMLARNAFGNFRDLLEDVTLHPMMGEYLSMVRNEKADAARNIRPDENYARELMQLFSIGLVMLNNDGSVQLDSDNKEIPTYDQDVIKAFSRVFTGWMYGNAPQWYWYEWLSSSEVVPMKAFAEFHDQDEKILLNGTVLPAGQNAEEDLAGALDNIFLHQNLAPFISKQLIQRLVTSNPSPQYITRVSAIFNNNGAGTRGDLGAVIKAILLDDEALNFVSGESTSGKLKEPMLKIAEVWRAFNVQGVSYRYDNGNLGPAAIRFYGASREAGQRPYGAPSVFNFYRPEFSQSGPIRDAALSSPEFQILNENFITTTTNRLFLAAYASDKDSNNPDREFPIAWDAGNVILDFDKEKALASSPENLLDRLNLLLMGGQMSEPMRTLILNHISGIPGTDTGLLNLRVYEAIFLITSSPEFAVQR